jgi:glycosyltransferase involved in cell wall biosynthesis
MDDMTAVTHPSAPRPVATSPARPLRIVYVWDADYPWDVRTEKICLALTRAGHDVHIVARNKQWRAPVEHLPEGTVHRMPPWRWAGVRADNTLGFPAFFSPRWRRLLRSTARSVGADLIIARDIPLCPTAVHVGRQLGIPVICDNAEHYPALMRALWQTGRQRPIDYLVRNPRAVEHVEQYAMARVDHIIVVVEEAADRLRALGIPADRITLVSNTPPLARIADARERPPRSDGRLDIVYLGNMEVVRGIFESIDAIAQLRRSGHNVRLRLIGRGRDDALLRAHASSLGLGPDAVEFLGYIASHRDALDIVASADIGLIPHRKCELWDATIPNKLFDYMAAGLPVVSSNAAPCARIVREAGVGEIFESENADSLAAAIVALSDPVSRRRAGDAGTRATRDRYNWEHDTAVLLDVIASVAVRA